MSCHGDWAPTPLSTEEVDAAEHDFLNEPGESARWCLRAIETIRSYEDAIRAEPLPKYLEAVKVSFGTNVLYSEYSRKYEENHAAAMLALSILTGCIPETVTDEWITANGGRVERYASY